MNANSFLNAATEPKGWFMQSVALRKSGMALWDQFKATFARPRPVDAEASDAMLTEAFNHLRISQLLYALAVETALKGVIIRDQPSEIEFSVTMDGKQDIVNVQLKRLGAKLGDGHNLEKLAEIANFVKPNDDRTCLLYTSPSPRDLSTSRMPSSA